MPHFSYIQDCSMKNLFLDLNGITHGDGQEINYPIKSNKEEFKQKEDKINEASKIQQFKSISR